jgi:hypothetical protein
MVRDAIISAATLAGLVGLATYYTGSPSIDSSRVARAADDDLAIDFNMDEFNDATFQEDFGFSDQDLAMFQDGPGDARAGGAKKQIAQVKNCMKNSKCTERAQGSVKNWAASSEKYITANPSRLLRAITTNYEEAENDFGYCTPNDDAVPCDGASSDPLAFYKAANNDNAAEQFSANAEVQGLIEGLDDSQAMQDALSALNPSGPRDQNNVFSKRAAKIFLIIPNGVPVSMPENYAFKFGNYWRWFKQFNSNYIGIAVPGGANRVNMHMWFLRQDKNLKTIMRTPAKTSNKFPWRRFDQIMLPNQNTAAQPKISQTLTSLWDVIDSKGMSAESTEGQDCFTIWFHQYIPADVLDLSDSLFQEETMNNLEKSCSIVHVWVGMGALGDSSTIKVVQYLQGLLQPSQMVSSSADPQMRKYYFVDDLDALAGEQGQTLMHQIYNDIALERTRSTCLLSSGANDLGSVFDAAADRYDEYYSYGNDDMSTTIDLSSRVVKSAGGGGHIAVTVAIVLVVSISSGIEDGTEIVGTGRQETGGSSSFKSNIVIDLVHQSLSLFTSKSIQIVNKIVFSHLGIGG